MPELHYIGISAAFDPYAEAEPVSYCPECGAPVYDGERIYYGHALRGFCTYWSTAAQAPQKQTHDILRDDFSIKKPMAGPLGQGGKYHVI